MENSFVHMMVVSKLLLIEAGQQLTWSGYIFTVFIHLEASFHINVISVISLLRKSPSFGFTKKANITSTERYTYNIKLLINDNIHFNIVVYIVANKL